MGPTCNVQFTDGWPRPWLASCSCTDQCHADVVVFFFFFFFDAHADVVDPRHWRIEKTTVGRLPISNGRWRKFKLTSSNRACMVAGCVTRGGGSSFPFVHPLVAASTLEDSMKRRGHSSRKRSIDLVSTLMNRPLMTRPGGRTFFSMRGGGPGGLCVEGSLAGFGCLYTRYFHLSPWFDVIDHRAIPNPWWTSFPGECLF
jgi:hypothetical protein